MTVITLIFVMLFVGLVVGLAMGFVILCVDRRRKKRTKMLEVKDGITLEYDCSLPGIYERLIAFFSDN